MEVFSAEFFQALAAIVVIDLVLAGDNAIVIALAARNVPRELQRRVILWGTVGAIVVRASMTMLMVWLLQVPGLLFAGGAVLVWIAYRLLLPEEAGENGGRLTPAASFWGALKTIVFADIVMGLDNVLAVAGAAHGSFLLVTLGLLISIPIVVWGSTIIMRWVDRFPAFVYLGAGVLAWTAVKMMTSEPLLGEFFGEHTYVAPLLYLSIVAGVLWAGLVRNHRRLESRISAYLARYAQPVHTVPPGPNLNRGEITMLRILVPVDASPNSLLAVKHMVSEFMKRSPVEIHLLNIQPPFSSHIAQFVGRKNRAAFHREQGEKALQPARLLLEQAGVPHSTHIETGDRAKVIAREARRLRCDRIVMAAARRKSLTRMLDDSVTSNVLELATVPVEVISGDGVSRWERFGVPAGIGVAFALVYAALE